MLMAVSLLHIWIASDIFDSPWLHIWLLRHIWWMTWPRVRWGRKSLVKEKQSVHDCRNPTCFVPTRLVYECNKMCVNGFLRRRKQLVCDEVMSVIHAWLGRWVAVFFSRTVNSTSIFITNCWRVVKVKSLEFKMKDFTRASILSYEKAYCQA